MKDYQKRANENYRAKFDIVQIRLVKGTKEQIINKTGKSISHYIQDLIDKDLHNNFDSPNTSEYRPNVTESSRTNENGFYDNSINNDIKIDSGANNECRKAYKDMSQEEINAMLADIPLTGKVKTHDFGLQNIQNDIDARSASINKPVEHEPTLAEMAHKLAQELEQKKESAKQEEQPPF